MTTILESEMMRKEYGRSRQAAETLGKPCMADGLFPLGGFFDKILVGCRTVSSEWPVPSVTNPFGTITISFLPN
jgi:hypothetical protein